MDRAKINRIWEEAHKLAELTASPPTPPTIDEWRRFEMEITKQVLQLNQVVIAP